VTFERLTKYDISRLALLQTSELPGAMAAQFGIGYARCFYRYVARSVQEVMLVRRTEGEIVAFCLASLGVHSLQQRLVTRTPLAFYASLRLMTPEFWRLVTNIARDVFSEASTALPAELSILPEVVMLACDSKARGRGHASRLLEEIEVILHDRGIREYVVRTFDDDNNSAVKFYSRRGFTVIARFVAHGTPFRLMRKTIHACPKVRVY
jgi:ribosomal protein S18 acetylase RimI-like enzyme